MHVQAANGTAAQKETSLPDVPRVEPGGHNGVSQVPCPPFSGLTTDMRAPQLPALPSAPTSQPRAPLPLAKPDEMGDSSVEIEVRNLDHATVQRMQERLASASPAGTPAKPARSPSGTESHDDGAGADAIGRLALGDASPALTPQRAALNRALSQRSAQSIESTQGVAYRDRSPSPLPPSSPPTATVVPAAAAPSTPATTSARTSRTTPASSAPTSTASSVILGSTSQRGHRSQPSNESGIIDPLRDAADDARSEGTLTAATSASSMPRSNGSAAAAAASPKPAQPQPPSPATAAAAQRARDAISLARNKSTSQKLRRPPPGMTLSAAEMDASDDEYE
jgi:hypothetical protein